MEGRQDPVRPIDKHIDNQELNALVPSTTEVENSLQNPSEDVVRVAERHVRSCAECNKKVSKYRQLVHRSSNVRVSQVAPPGTCCPKDDDVDWPEVATGLWPALKATQLIMHAATCDHCGPLMRAATFVDDEPTPHEARLLAQLKMPSRPITIPAASWHSPSRWPLMRWLAPALALIVIVAIVIALRPTSRAPLTGPEFAELAVHTHEQYAKGSLGLDVRSTSQQTLNDWFKKTLQFPLALPANSPAPGEVRPYKIEGARLVQADGKSAAFIAYKMDTGPASLVVTPETVAVASGGVAVNFKKVSFHYATVEGYKVVTWTQHGRTYALVSEEGNSTQQSCMVCHSAMKDRDLTNTPTPLIKSVLQ